MAAITALVKCKRIKKVKSLEISVLETSFMKLFYRIISKVIGASPSRYSLINTISVHNVYFIPLGHSLGPRYTLLIYNKLCTCFGMSRKFL